MIPQILFQTGQNFGVAIGYGQHEAILHIRTRSSCVRHLGWSYYSANGIKAQPEPMNGYMNGHMKGRREVGAKVIQIRNQ